MLAALILLATWIVLGIPVALVGFSWAFVTRDISLLYRGAIWVMRTGMRAAGIRVEARWEAPPDPTQRYIFLSNHVSNLDPVVLFPLLPSRVSAFIKRSLTKIPVLGYGMELARFIPVDRDGSVDAAAASVERAAQVLASGLHIVSFVEGTRSRDGRLQPFKKGPFYLAMESSAPVVPVTIRGTEKLMRKGSLKVYPGTVRVIFHDPINPKDYATREELMVAVREAIEATT